MAIIIILQIILFIPSFFFYRKRIKKHSKNHYNLLSVLAIFTMPIIYTTVLCILITGIIDPIWRSKDFDSKLWKENKSIRYRMVKKLKSENLLIGKTKSEVIELLGTKYKENCAVWVCDKTICYVAHDPDDIGFLDHYEFVVCFDSKNTVYKVSYEYI